MKNKNTLFVKATDIVYDTEGEITDLFGGEANYSWIQSAKKALDIDLFVQRNTAA